ncbi:MAG: hypothetical protein ACD_32C00145G0007 [uncultured bacterium]|nr:MAG: hypothetical protein ACD_32C00145G0007 [uncultured bacterium]KKR24083.1 MAG: hypothetical protein UT54_C0031G0008 [Candidatus Daviesbacteria bacterium GW2011_GWB1_39_5]OGE22450.1 MAG: hypothetical protein A2778_00125 [Candidatus Daviesbacteria bacterium RIFCSPHIGHO2_01_FULL_40_24]OGE30496.1 MAG: hypothetical protein A3C29_07010 [Candidatus Daviesbacteria bacterium RIFCSPHIGHO2_02_FULL_40_16]OGE43218.1 MAG: hypothetical protein A3A53_05935 [Candidatus Daviesbacteria bacterium RIFCSPLOWO2
MKKVAVIGTGIMGHGIALNFLKKGFETFVWNRNRERLKDLKGAKIANTPKEATENADIIFEVTANDASSKSVWLGKNGIMKGADPGKILIVCATLSVEWTEKLAGLCAKKGITFFDMPMTGSRAGAESGKLVLLVGGDREKLSKVKPVLKAISGEVLYFGKAGAGMKYKLILNLLQAIHVFGMGEALKLAKDANLDIKAVGDALSVRPGGLATNMAWKNYQQEPTQTNFSVEWITKDLKYAKKLSKSPTLFLNAALKRLQKGLKKSMHQKDWTLVNKLT